jgi:hypothetical protein
MAEETSVATTGLTVSGSSEEAVAIGKYKKLLAVARNSLEANQHSLAEKDRQIEALKKALETELSKHRVVQSDDLDVNTKPRRILRRLDINGTVWLLFEYVNGPDSWSQYHTEQEAQDFISRLPGEPLTIPHRCFTPHESSLIVSIICITIKNYLFLI